MKSEWEFKFETRDFRFEREHKYIATVNEPVTLGDRSIEKLEFLVRIAPSDTKPEPGVDQVGSLFITLPGSQSETKAFAYQLAANLTDRITFQSGDFRTQYGYVTCKRIPENKQEEEEFGDKLYSIEFVLTEVLAPEPFDSVAFVQPPTQSVHLGLVSQYNETKRDSSPIRQFLGFFRILESLYHSQDEKKTLKQALGSSSELKQVYTLLVDNENFDAFIENIVDIRHRCAHLKLQKGFGYVPADPAIGVEVQPYLPLLNEMTYICIRGTDAHAENNDEVRP